MKIDIWSDFVCPFCYIGKQHIEEAVKDKKNIKFEYHSFELDPSAPEKVEESMPDYFAKTKGFTPEQAETMVAQITEMANQAGLAFHYETIQHSNTLKAHRLSQYAKEQGKGIHFMELASEGYFSNGEWLNDNAFLLTIADQLNLDQEQAKKVLESKDAYLSDVQRDIAKAQEIGVEGVPFFVIDGKYGLSGAQPVETFKQVLNEIEEKEQS
ncbi:MAG: DsbA family oxidoreductase [Pisciglobus halotolerans]|nr:DsbA family oxidoreductase [Pisciglobus halotolerans]